MSNIRTYEISHNEQKPLPILQKDTTDYLLGGSLVMKNGKIDKFLFEGGYAQAYPVYSGSVSKPMTFYLEKDEDMVSDSKTYDQWHNAQEAMHIADFLNSTITIRITSATTARWWMQVEM